MILQQSVNLDEFSKRLDRILKSTDSDYQKQRDLERLKTDMEFVFGIPLITSEKFNLNHPEVMYLYSIVKSKMV